MEPRDAEKAVIDAAFRCLIDQAVAAREAERLAVQSLTIFFAGAAGLIAAGARSTAFVQADLFGYGLGLNLLSFFLTCFGWTAHRRLKIAVVNSSAIEDYILGKGIISKQEIIPFRVFPYHKSRSGKISFLSYPIFFSRTLGFFAFGLSAYFIVRYM